MRTLDHEIYIFFKTNKVLELKKQNSLNYKFHNYIILINITIETQKLLVMQIIFTSIKWIEWFRDNFWRIMSVIFEMFHYSDLLLNVIQLIVLKSKIKIKWKI